MEGPKRIYLTKDEESFSEVLWCEDRINDDDIEYIRADLVKGLEEAARKTIQSIETADIRGIMQASEELQQALKALER